MELKFKMDVYPFFEETTKKTIWIAEYSQISGIVGQGDTSEEAIRDLVELSQEIIKDYDENPNILPDPIEFGDENEFSGNISLRMSKSLHKKTSELAKSEGISLNAFLNEAISIHVGVKKYENRPIEHFHTHIHQNETTYLQDEDLWKHVNVTDYRMGDIN